MGKGLGFLPIHDSFAVFLDVRRVAASDWR
jgi:hypothetical protein